MMHMHRGDVGSPNRGRSNFALLACPPVVTLTSIATPLPEVLLLALHAGERLRGQATDDRLNLMQLVLGAEVGE